MMQEISRVEIQANDLPLVLTVGECATFLRLGRSKTYELVRSGVIPSIRLGHQYRIPRETLLEWLGSDEAQGKAVGGATLTAWIEGVQSGRAQASK